MGKIKAKDLVSGIRGMSESEVLAKCEEFLKDIETTVRDENGEVLKPPYGIVPTFSAFADYIGQPRADVHEWLRGHPVAGKSMRDMVADTLASGAMKKAYEARIATFALKNWCGWEEAPPKQASKSKEVADEKKAAEKLENYYASERKKFKIV